MRAMSIFLLFQRGMRMGKATSLAKGNSPSCLAGFINSEQEAEGGFVHSMHAVYLYRKAITDFISNTWEVSGLPGTTLPFSDKKTYCKTDTPDTFTLNLSSIKPFRWL